MPATGDVIFVRTLTVPLEDLSFRAPARIGIGIIDETSMRSKIILCLPPDLTIFF
jgi:hypothetical protein